MKYTGGEQRSVLGRDMAKSGFLVASLARQGVYAILSSYKLISFTQPSPTQPKRRLNTICTALANRSNSRYA
jgi:hypothetical protein